MLRSGRRISSCFSRPRRALTAFPKEPRRCLALASLSRPPRLASVLSDAAIITSSRRTLPSAPRWLSTASLDEEQDDDAGNWKEGRRSGIRNVAVVAHVDHGKTTLIDQLLQTCLQTSTTTEITGEGERVMDSGDLEKERGITITSKVTRLLLDDETVINVVDTPGHADFCGEVDRILHMVDGVLLVVDAAEGPRPQTKYVTSRALQLGLTPLIVLNKCDRPEALAKLDSGETETQLLDLFASLGATEDQMDCPTLYASARQGWITEDPVQALEWASTSACSSSENMRPLLQEILQTMPEPRIRTYNDDNLPVEPLSLAAVTVGRDAYLGRTCTGRIVSGSVAVGDKVAILPRGAASSSELSTSSTITGIFVHHGVERVGLEEATGSKVATAGDIVTLAGLPEVLAVGDTVTLAQQPVDRPLTTPPLAPPTLSMDFGANNGPLAGKEGTQIASSKIRDRLVAETDNNVTLKVEISDTDREKTVVLARGELQLGILIEQMRREGFEMTIAPPRTVLSTCPDTGRTLEPFEEVLVDVDDEYVGAVVSSVTGDRKGTMLEMSESSADDGRSRLSFEMPTRGLLGFHSSIATLTRGSAVVTHLFLENREHVGSLGLGLDKSKLVSNTSGKANAFALSSLSARGVLFVAPGDDVYSGMVVGENAKPGPDLEVNPVRAKETSNMRTQAKDERVTLAPPKKMSLEELIGYMGDDEVIEVTPRSIRLRKAELDSSTRERLARAKAKKLRSMKEA